MYETDDGPKEEKSEIMRLSSDLYSIEKPATPIIIRKDIRMDNIVAKGAVIEKLAGGFGWAEGPYWIESE